MGTETSGSVVSPAHESGVVGLKPTLGLVPRTGIVPISHSQDTAGPIARSARDAAVAAAHDGRPRRSRTRRVACVPVPEMTLSQRPGGRDDWHRHRGGAGVADVDAASLNLARAALQRAGATVRDVTFPSREELKQQGWMLEVLEYEFKGDLNAYLSGVTDGPGTLAT